MSIKQRITILVTFSLSLLWSAGVFSGASDSEGASAMKQMAKIMHRLKHYPSPQGKETLQAIAQSKATKKNERTLASAMLNLDHKVTSAYREGLEDITASGSASADEKALATILLNFSHRPSSEDKKRLKAMME